MFQQLVEFICSFEAQGRKFGLWTRVNMADYTMLTFDAV